MEPILITGATGKTGKAVAELLLAKGAPVRALVHRNDHRSETLRKKGASIVVGDLYDPLALRRALTGVARAYYVPPFQPHMIHSAVAFAQAARVAQVKAVVWMSQWLSSPNHPSWMTRQTWLADQLFFALPDTARVKVGPGYFADNYLRVIEFAVHLGFMPLMAGAGKNAPPSNEDIARVVAAILLDPEPHDGRSYRPTGPALLSEQDMVNIVSRELGRRVLSRKMPLWLLARAARMQGETAFGVANLRHYIEDHRQGAFALGAPTDDVLNVTGEPAEPFETTVRRYIRARSGSFLATLIDFLRLPFSPGYDVACAERQLAIPHPVTADYAVRSAEWRQEHHLPAAEMMAAI